MIDPKTGSVSFEQPPLTVGPALTRTLFLSEAWSTGATDWVINEPWHSWKLSGRYVSASLPFLVVLYFQGERLAMVSILHDDPKFGTSWNDHSVEKEMSRKASHDRWLTASLGAGRSFSWGSVWSGYDERAGDSSIMVRYEPR